MWYLSCFLTRDVILDIVFVWLMIKSTNYFIEICPLLFCCCAAARYCDLWCCAVETGEGARSSSTDYRDLKAHGCVSTFCVNKFLCECVLRRASV